ncbi:metallophosphoesterase [Halosimplex amylolyticum]|uniref:metallophosphoesterase n=1 Tax=Halosimplex amylolyticum TaxID=3396616 RepID=UPI003F56DF52
MELGIVSDTHDDLDAVEDAVTVFEREGVDAVVHCGDIVAPFSATPFDSSFDFYAVRGNNDGEWALQSTVDEFGTYLGEVGELTFDGSEIAVYHGTGAPLVDALVACGRYDYVLHGHTHEFVHEDRAGTVRINPGGISFEGAPGPHYAVVLDTETGEIERFELSAGSA